MNQLIPALKNFGQNFLTNPRITQRIALMCKINPNDQVWEIGPGLGHLTRELLAYNPKKLTALEIDPRMVPSLESMQHNNPNFNFIMGDALEFDFAQIPDQSIIVSNLPYNIATPLITGWLHLLHGNPQKIKHLILMVQKEVAQRIIAKPDNKIYGRLSILTQMVCSVEKCFDVPPSAFVPQPKVVSSIIRLTPKAEQAPINLHHLENLTHELFMKRRKMLRTILKDKISEQALRSININPESRPENLSQDQILRLYRATLEAGN